MASTRIATLTGSPPNGAGSSKPGRRTIDVTVHLGYVSSRGRSRKLCIATLSIETAWTAARSLEHAGLLHAGLEVAFDKAADIADDIRSAYAAAEGWGGKVVASYSMTCAPGYEGEIHKPKGDPSECLFLIMELPDGYEER